MTLLWQIEFTAVHITWINVYFIYLYHFTDTDSYEMCRDEALYPVYEVNSLVVPFGCKSENT